MVGDAVGVMGEDLGRRQCHLLGHLAQPQEVDVDASAQDVVHHNVRLEFDGCLVLSQTVRDLWEDEGRDEREAWK